MFIFNLINIHEYTYIRERESINIQYIYIYKRERESINVQNLELAIINILQKFVHECMIKVCQMRTCSRTIFLTMRKAI